jgi:Arc/MetJ family transcription regulator
MRTTVDIPEDLLEEAKKVSATRSIRDTVVAALEELIRKGRREELRKLAGTMELKVDLKRSRERKER